MNETTHVVRGTLLPDGTLELAERLNLPAGTVEVTVRSLVTESQTGNWFAAPRQIQVGQGTPGKPCRSQEEIDAGLAFHRDRGEEKARGLGETTRANPASGIRQATPPPLPRDPHTETLWQYMQRSRAELEAAGHEFRTKEEIDADIAELRDWDGKVEEVYRQAEEERERVAPK